MWVPDQALRHHCDVTAQKVAFTRGGIETDTELMFQVGFSAFANFFNFDVAEINGQWHYLERVDSAKAI